MRLADEARAVVNDARDLGGLFGDAVEQLGKLVQNEVDLAKAEVSEKVSQASKGVALLVGAGVLAIPVLVLLFMTLALWLQSLGLSPVLAHLAATVIGGVLSGILALVGKRQMSADKLTPKVTLQQVRQDMQVAKELTR